MIGLEQPMQISFMNTKNRVRKVNFVELKKRKYGIYWMQKAQRASANLALEYAISQANKLNVPLIVFFLLMEKYPDANARAYKFMLEGLLEVKKKLAARKIPFVIKSVEDNHSFPLAFKESSFIVTEKAYLKFPRNWRLNLETQLQCPIWEVETETVVPVEIASQKEEYSAATLRRKLKPKIEEYLHLPSQQYLENTGELPNSEQFLSLNPATLLQHFKDIQKLPKTSLLGGYFEAKHKLEEFLQNKLPSYDDRRNEPAAGVQSELSPYLHFGQISVQQVALAAQKKKQIAAGFLDELIIRRELAINYVYYNHHYDEFRALPNWAKESLNEHAGDKREYLYSLQELEKAETHDIFWNAAQKEMILTGKMQGYMRMYWGKKILEWSNSPQLAWQNALYLNNKYELDGRDANAYAGVAWCFGKHDQGWKERPIFGKVRYMNANGLKRKYNMTAYVNKVAELEKK